MMPNLLTMSINQTQNVPIIIGNTATFTVNIKNISEMQRVYNLGVTLTLPDGMVLSTATLAQTSSVTHPDNRMTYNWVNIKDLAPMEVNFNLSMTVRCDTKFKNGTAIPFGYIFSGIKVGAQVDTMPRGTYDDGNEVITEEMVMTYVTVRFTGTITTAGKVLKGAGTLPTLTDYTQVSTATCKLMNNEVYASQVNISILLEDGIRYIGNIVATGTDATQLTNPIVSLVRIEGKSYIQLYYRNITLSVKSSTTVTFSYAVWNRYNNNQGELIAHGTKLNMLINMSLADPLINVSSSGRTSFLAMDLIIGTAINHATVDVQMNVIYTYSYQVGQYYTIQDIVVRYFLPDGIGYSTTSVTPFSVVDDLALQGYLITYHLPLAPQNSSHTVTISAGVAPYYRYKEDNQRANLPVVASDPFLAEASIYGTLVGDLSSVADSAQVGSAIGIGTINKQFIKAYYRDGTPKSITVLAPLDLAEYALTYNASSLNAIQKQVYIDDFFPLSADPIDQLTYTYTGITPIQSPQLISPHGVDFRYGDLAGQSSGAIHFKVPIATLGSPTQNANLMKLKGINTYGNAYSDRAQVNINIGAPNISLTKSVTGLNKSAIQVNEVYTYTVVVKHSNNLGTETDAFDFTLTDSLSERWFILDEESIRILGTGSYKSPTVQGSNIVVAINKLAPGELITLSYNVTISAVLAPGVSITTTATTTNPYSQEYDAAQTNFQYTNLNKSASVTLASKAITLTKTNGAGTFKVGSLMPYVLTVNVPIGTIAYGLYVRDLLPSGEQVYVGPAYRNGLQVTPSISANRVTFLAESSVDARGAAQTIAYRMTAKVADASKSINGTTSTQTNTMQCLYQQVQGGSLTTLNKNLIVPINHPNLIMSLSATDRTTATIYTGVASISLASVLQFKLIFQNNSAIQLTNGTIEIPIDPKFLFVSLDTTVLCTAHYNVSDKKVVITVPLLTSSSSGYVAFTVLPQPTLRVGTSMNTQATAVSYYNDLSVTKVYSGEQSNSVTCTLAPGVSLKPNPLYQIGETTSFNVTPPGATAVIMDYFKNLGGGYDDFTLVIQRVEIPYSLYIDDTKIEDIPANMLYQADLETMTHLASGTSKVIKILAVIPVDQALGVRHDFIVTVRSRTSPYPEKTVLNIDPNPF